MTDVKATYTVSAKLYFQTGSNATSEKTFEFDLTSSMSDSLTFASTSSDDSEDSEGDEDSEETSSTSSDSDSVVPDGYSDYVVYWLIEDIDRVLPHLDDKDMEELAKRVTGKLQNMTDEEFTEVDLEAAE